MARPESINEKPEVRLASLTTLVESGEWERASKALSNNESYVVWNPGYDRSEIISQWKLIVNKIENEEIKRIKMGIVEDLELPAVPELEELEEPNVPHVEGVEQQHVPHVEGVEQQHAPHVE